MKASKLIRFYKNSNGPVIGAVKRSVFKKDGLYFKDLDGSGIFKDFDDWRISAEERAKSFVSVLTTEEKIAQLFISDWRMAKYPSPSPMNPSADPPDKTDETGLLDEDEKEITNIFGTQYIPSTTKLITLWFNRHLILRANPSPEDLVDWINQLQSLSESCERFIPVQVVSNSRNENGEIVFGMNEASGVFATWPGTLGIAAAVKGDGLEIIDRFASCIKREWDAVGMKKGYMYMADTVTDPRWQRTYGTFGEDPSLIKEIFSRLIPGIQGSDDGVTEDGVAVTVKHFPGGGARENGFDPHYKAGQWNVYRTEGSLEKYHLPPFIPAIEKNASSIMPYYSKPSSAKSAEQIAESGKAHRFDPYGFAYNKYFITTLLREKLGFSGYINSDTGILHNMCWGVEALDTAERIGFAVNNAGTDLISGLFDNKAGMEAYERARNDYYDTHKVPQGFKREEITLSEEALNKAVVRTLTELFKLGMFENPYRNAKEAEIVISNKEDWKEAELVHRKSVVLLKNKNVLPLNLNGKKVYAEAFSATEEKAKTATLALREMLKDRGLTLSESDNNADLAVLMINPQSGAYFSATSGYLELDICDGKVVHNVDEDGKPTEETHTETTLFASSRIKEISENLHKRGGFVISSVNVTLAWILKNVEPYSDALTVGFDTYPSAVIDVLLGAFSPVGKLPITLPRSDEVLEVDKDGICVSPNDVPGFDKDKYIDERLKDQNGKAYAYRDSEGNYYEYGFGLSY